MVNAEPGVSPALAERVRRAIEELRFRPDAGARSLRRSDGRTSSIGVLLEDVANPFSASVQRAVEDVARARGVPVDSVVTTNAAGAAEGVRHLAAAGHRRIAYLGDSPAIPTARQRYEGYRAALAALGLPPADDLVVQGLRDPAVADGAVTALLDRPDPPTALFAAQNLVTIGAVRALRRAGRERTVALLGFDDFPLADLLAPGVSVVAQDPAAMGRLAAGILFDRIGGDGGTPGTHVVPTTLVRRGSGEIRCA